MGFFSRVFGPPSYDTPQNATKTTKEKEIKTITAINYRPARCSPQSRQSGRGRGMHRVDRAFGIVAAVVVTIGAAPRPRAAGTPFGVTAPD
jgi:hypothetical protein